VALFHIVSRSEWGARGSDGYAPASLAREGFVHLSTEEQWPRTAERFFAQRDDLLVLVVRPERLTAPVRYEVADGENFPHLYGALNLDAVEDVAAIVEVDGRFELRRGVDGVARQLAQAYAAAPVVEAVALAGSRTGPVGADAVSDVDLYVYCRGPLPLDVRAAIASRHAYAAAGPAEVGNAFWESGDEWEADEPRVKVDVMVRDVGWMEDEFARVLDRAAATLGYSTCILHNVKSSVGLFDRSGWYAGLKTRAGGPYPLALRDAIVAKNHPVLRDARSSYLGQIRAAAGRGDRVSIQHRVAALLASAFDIVFAVNLVAHPGEKRLVSIATERCASLPDGFGGAVAALLDASRDPSDAVGRAEEFVDRLDDWLDGLGLRPAWPPAGRAGRQVVPESRTP
jgi:uncharacterized protein (DUF952 family)